MKKILIDQRNVKDYRLAHLPGAISFEMQLNAADKNDAAGIEAERFEKLLRYFDDVGVGYNTEINIYCYGGDCAGRTVDKLKALGYDNVVNLGGYDALVNKVVK